MTVPFEPIAMRPSLRLALLPVAALGLAVSSSAQVVPRALLITDTELPGVPGRVVTNVTRIAPSHAGGIIATLTSRDFMGATTDSLLWGSLGASSLTRLDVSDASGPLQITRFDEIGGANADALASIVTTVAGAAVVADGQFVARRNETTGPGGSGWTSFSGLSFDGNGEPWFQGRYSGAMTGAGFFRRTTPIFLSGDTILGMPGVVSPAAAPAPGFDVSSDGAHWLAVVRTNANVRSYVVRDGSVLSAGGALLETGTTLPAAFQLSPGETYNFFGVVQIASNDRWAVIGGTPSEFIIRDGSMYRRDGDVVDGRTIANGAEAIALDDAGSIAYVVAVDDAGSTTPNAVFREETFLYQEGAAVDVDGDGVPDSAFTVSTIFGDRGRLAMTEDGAVYSIVRLDTPSGQRTALLVAEQALAAPYCSSAVNASGARARMQTLGSVAVAANDVTLRCVDMPVNTFGLFVTSRSRGFTANPGGSLGDLCIGGTIGRFNGLIQNSGSAGQISAAINAAALPEGGATVAAAPGDTWYFQCWFRDLNMGLPASNFSDGVELTFR